MAGLDIGVIPGATALIQAEFAVVGRTTGWFGMASRRLRSIGR